MELVFLGTGAGLPSKQRNVSCCLLSLIAERNAIWLFDCGEGTQHQLMQSSLKLGKVEKIFISHLHGDHLFGLPGLLSTRSFKGGDEPITVYGPMGIKAYLKTVFEFSSTYITYPLTIIEIAEGIIFEDTQFSVIAHQLKHRIPSYGFRIVEKDKLGSLDAQRLKEIGVPSGPIFQKLKKGETVALADGRVIDGKDFLSPNKKGKVIAIFGDTEPCDAELVIAKGADVIVHEATFEANMAGQAKEHGHSTTQQTAQMAKDCGAKKLIITHISSRYGLEDNERLVEECRAIFSNTYIAYDFAVFEI